VQGLKEDLVHKLDRARKYYGHPLVITSGYRTKEENLRVGGVPDSAHTHGEAVDLRAPKDQEMREKLAWALGCAGFQRVGRYFRHFHADTDYDKPSPAFWDGGGSS